MVAIKDMEMPSTCYKCDFCHYDNSEGIDVCDITGNYISAIDGKNKRDDDCPLVEIITCNDCEYCKGDTVGGIKHLWCEKDSCAVSEDYYCSGGERRE